MRELDGIATQYMVSTGGAFFEQDYHQGLYVAFNCEKNYSRYI